MRIFFISIFLYTIIITKADDSDSKYIDLLPEKEKQEFLENIARRILEEIQTKDDRPKESSEIQDEQLNEHDAFVHKIMKEESENLRRQNNNTEEKSGINIKIGRILAREEEKTVDGYVDLTLRSDKNRTKRESKRRVFTEPDNSTERDSKESDVDIQVKDFKRSIRNSAEVTTPGENDVTMIDSTEENKTPIHEQNNEKEATTQYKYNQQETEVTTSDDSKSSENIPNNKKGLNKNNNATEINTESNDDRQETEFITQNSFQNLFTGETVTTPPTILQLEHIQKKYENFNYDKSETMTNENIINPNAVISAETTKTPSEKVLNSSNQDILSIIETNKTKKKVLKDSDVIKIEIATVQDSNNVPSTTENSDIINKGQKTANPTVITTTEETKVLTPTVLNTTYQSSNKEKDLLRNQSSKDKGDKIDNKTKKLKSIAHSVKMSTESKNFANEVIKALKLKLLDKSLRNENTYDTTPQYIENQPMVHEVFEISPDVSPFVKLKPSQPFQSQRLNDNQIKTLKSAQKPLIALLERKQPKFKQPVVSEEPYHVPIYNYLPNNAFYNPHNVLGPNPNNNDNDEGYIIKRDAGYIFPSLMPKSAMNLINETPERDEQPFHVPVYYYSPNNAYYNPNNYYGPNLKDSNEKRDENNEYDNASYDSDTNNEKNKGRNQIEWQYYNDPHIRIKNEQEPTEEKKKTKGEPFEVNLPKSVVDFIFNHTNIDLKGYIDAKYNNKDKKALRCCTYKKKCKKCNSEPISKAIFENDDEKVTDMPMVETMSKIRHIMLEAKYFINPPKTDTSKYDSYFEDTEEELKEEQDIKKGHKRNYIRALPNHYGDIFNREKSKQDPQNIALDYYERYITENNSEEKLKTDSKYNKNPVKLAYYINPKSNRYPKDYLHKNKRLNELFDKYRKPQKELEKHNILKELLKKFNKPHKRAKPKLKEYRNIAKTILRYAKDDKKTELNMIKEITNFVKDEEILELYLQLEKLEQEEAKKQMQRSVEVKNELDVFGEVLGDMIKENNKALGNYDWLGTTVDVQSAVKKMVEMVKSVQGDEDIHPSDLELLKYIVYLYACARDELDQKFSQKQLRGLIIPRGKRPRKLIRERGVIIRAWQVRLRPKVIPEQDLREFRRFLDELQTALYDLHTALKYISMVTKYNNQRWFESLKQIHIESKRKTLLEIILHLCTTRLLGMIEESAKNGLEDDFMEYIKKNEREVDETRKEFVFVLKLLQEIKRIQ